MGALGTAVGIGLKLFKGLRARRKAKRAERKSKRAEKKLKAQQLALSQLVVSNPNSNSMESTLTEAQETVFSAVKPQNVNATDGDTDNSGSVLGGKGLMGFLKSLPTWVLIAVPGGIALLLFFLFKRKRK